MSGPTPSVGDESVVTDEPAVAAVADPIDDELEQASDEREETTESFLVDLQRVSADFANFRKQTEKRQRDLVQQAGSRLVMQLLPVLDAFDAAVQHDTEGVEPIRAQLLSVLEREGLEQIGFESEPFDPSRHEAAVHEPADEAQDVPIVSEVLRTGYAWNGRVLRAAMVKVKG